jgi:hypothetical protein
MCTGLYWTAPAGLPGLTAQQVASRLGLQASPGFRGVTDWLDVLVSLDNLLRSGEAAQFLLIIKHIIVSSASFRAVLAAVRCVHAGAGAGAQYRNTADAQQYLASRAMLCCVMLRLVTKQW